MAQVGRVMVFDHDGTLTRIKGYAREFADDMSGDFPWMGFPSEVHYHLEMGMRALYENPEETISILPGSPPSGRAAADPLIAAQVAAQRLLLSDSDALAALRARFPEVPCVATAYTTQLHHRHKASAAEYREGVEAYFRELKESSIKTYIVTNSGTEEISRMMLAWEDKEVGAWLAGNVYGGARNSWAAAASLSISTPL
jgi:phosphoglycolate phosphatase-like HAD superfamily hydrolase